MLRGPPFASLFASQLLGKQSGRPFECLAHRVAVQAKLLCENFQEAIPESPLAAETSLSRGSGSAGTDRLTRLIDPSPAVGIAADFASADL